MRPGPLLVAVAGVGLSAGAIRARSLEGDSPGRVVAITFLGAALVATGIALWTRRPGSGGPLLAASGLAWLGWNLREVASPWGFTIGWSLVGLYLGLLICLVLAFPHDLPRGWPARTLAALALGSAVLAGPVAMLVWDSRTSRTTEVVNQNGFLLTSDPGARDALLLAAILIDLAVAAATLVLCGWRWHRGGPAARRAFAPVLIGFAILTTFLVVWLATEAHRRTDPDAGTLGWVALAAMAAVPIGVVVGLARARARPVAVADLVSGLEGRVGPAAIELALARALHDPSLRVLVPSGPDAWVNAHGRPADPAAANGHARTTLSQGDRVVGVLMHDPSLTWRPELLRAAGATAALALDNAQLGEDLRAQLVEVQAARRRLLETGDAERRRLERDLHDGAQQRLVGLGLVLRMARSRAATDEDVAPLLEEAEEGLRLALDDLRNLARGIHPAALAEGGLSPALRVLASRAPFPVAVECPDERLPAAIETAIWFVVSEALTNVAKHAEASRATVRVALGDGRVRVEVADDGRGGAEAGAGSGLGGLMERVAALGGTLTVSGGAGGGTLLAAEFPCG